MKEITNIEVKAKLGSGKCASSWHFSICRKFW
jgi:hypothetical protein